MFFEAGVNFASNNGPLLSLQFSCWIPAFAHICLNRGKNAVISPHPLHPYPIHYQSNPKETKTAPSARIAGLSGLITGRGMDLQTGWFCHFERQRCIRDGNVCFVLCLYLAQIMRSTRRNGGAAGRFAQKEGCEFEMQQVRSSKEWTCGVFSERHAVFKGSKVALCSLCLNLRQT